MAHPEITSQSDCFVWFTLSNKPQYTCVIDKVDYYRYVHNMTCWYIHVATQRRTNLPYIRTGGTPNTHLHRVVAKAGPYNPQLQVDHINRDSLDNRSSNLRTCDSKTNKMNSDRMDAVIVYRGIVITFIKKRQAFQAYSMGIYYGGGKNINTVKQKIDIKLGANACA